MRAGILLCLLAGSASGGASDRSAGDRRDDTRRWTRIELIGRYSFTGELIEDRDLSGLAFISARFGLVGADEARQVQVVEISRQARTLRIVETISLLPSGSEIDTEAVAADGDCYYIVGSHGVAKVTGAHQSNRYSIFRLAVDPATGMPSGSFVARSLKAASLADVLRADPVLGAHFGKPLQRRGLNIEGLAARDGRLYVGFRGPNLDGYAFVMEIRAEDVFAGKPRPAYVLHKLRLGKGLGIRELVAARSGFLIIAGNAGSEPSDEFAQSEDYEKDREFFLFRWDGKTPDVQQVGTLPKTDGQAEAMAILEEAEDHLTVLVLFDGPGGGRPSLYRIE